MLLRILPGEVRAVSGHGSVGATNFSRCTADRTSGNQERGFLLVVGCAVDDGLVLCASVACEYHRARRADGRNGFGIDTGERRTE